ncbi:MAG: tripartite tricarboxylate transporter substrate binding protein [Betaproteobacteria bacterium]|nr:MAG: tripartite tricarboxylate transporter substrate binding protein [Betaproteobacteria bacterium]
MRLSLVRSALSAVLAIAAAGAAAQNYPTRPVRLVVPFPPGGAVDTIARVISPALGERLGQQLVIDNRGGANAIIGTDIAAKAAPDGYTLLIVPAGHAITPNVTRKLPYDTLKDLTAVGLVGNGAYVLVINPGIPAKTVKEFIAYAKARPGKLNYAATGYGNATHLAGELFKVLAGVDMVYVFYKGGGPALTDVIGGQVSLIFAGVASSAGHIKSGKLRALGVTTARRAAALPDVPTIAEAGVPGYEVDGWYGILAPAKTPAAIVKRLNADINAVVATDDAKQRLLAVGLQARGTTPSEFHDMIVKDIARWSSLVKKARIEPQ